MKKIVLLSVFFFCLALAPQVFAQGFTALAPIPGLTSPDATSVVSSTHFATFFNNLYKYCIGLAAVFAVIMIIWGGLEISTQDSVSKQGAGREKIQNALLGLVLVLSPVLVFSIINPSILNLSLNLDRLDLSHAPYVQTTVTPNIQQAGSVRPGSLSNVNTGTCIAFTEGPYTTPQPCAWCYRVATPFQNTDREINNNQPYTANYYCGRSQPSCVQFTNGGGDATPADGARCVQTPS